MPMEILGCINSVAETRLALRLASSVSVCRPRLGSDKLAVFEVVMLVVMQAHATEEQVRAVCQKIESLGYRAHPIPGAQRTAIGITGNRGEVEAGTLEEMTGVQEVIRVSKPYKLVSLLPRHQCDVRRTRSGDYRGTMRDREPRTGVCR